MTFQLSDATRAVLDELERMRLSEERATDTPFGYNQMTGVSGESDIVSSGPGLLLTPEGRGRSRTRGVRP